MIKVALVFLSVIALLSASGCKTCTCKTIICAAFSDSSFDKWAPYEEGDLLIFKNQSGVADTIRIAALRKSDAYESKTGGGYGCGKGCYTDATAYGTDMSGNNLEKFSINQTKSDPNGNSIPQTIQVSLRLKNFNLNAKALVDTGFVNGTVYNGVGITTRFSTALTVLSKNFTDVQTLSLDTASYKVNGPFKLYLAAGKGLVAWESYPDKTIWVRE